MPAERGRSTSGRGHHCRRQTAGSYHARRRLSFRIVERNSEERPVGARALYKFPARANGRLLFYSRRIARDVGVERSFFVYRPGVSAESEVDFAMRNEGSEKAKPGF